MKDVAFGQYYPVNSFVHRLDPRLKLLFLIAFIVAIFLASNFYGLAACAFVLIVTIFFSRVPILKVLRSVRAVLFLVLFTTALNVLFYGDSITVGANSSNYVGCGPHAGSYTEMVRDYLLRRYPDAQIAYENTAVGGTDSYWGASLAGGTAGHLEAGEGDHLKVRVLDKAPDLLFIAFGMNDAEHEPTSYKKNIRTMIERVRTQYPDTEIMLIAGMTANPETYFYNKDAEAYEQALIELGGEFSHVGVATVHDTAKSVYEMGKRFRDCTGNNVNHPNDFMMRIYAQTVLCTMFGDDYIECI